MAQGGSVLKNLKSHNGNFMGFRGLNDVTSDKKEPKRKKETLNRRYNKLMEETRSERYVPHRLKSNQ